MSISPSLGTFGALIRIKSYIGSRKKYFDVGLSGPLAGFIVCVGVLIYGFTHIPSIDYLYSIHPEYLKYGQDYAQHVYQAGDGGFSLGSNLLMKGLAWLFVADPSTIPNAHELMHYPFLFAGYLSLFFTALNLLPIGQLDGGHILYGLIGDKAHRIFSKWLFLLLLFLGGIGMVSPQMPTEDILIYSPLYLFFLYMCFYKMTENRLERVYYATIIFALQFGCKLIFPSFEGFSVWLAFMFMLGRFLGIYHPNTYDQQPLGRKRVILGWLAMLIFILSFTPQVFIMN